MIGDESTKLIAQLIQDLKDSHARNADVLERLAQAQVLLQKYANLVDKLMEERAPYLSR